MRFSPGKLWRWVGRPFLQKLCPACNRGEVSSPAHSNSRAIGQSARPGLSWCIFRGIPRTTILIFLKFFCRRGNSTTGALLFWLFWGIKSERSACRQSQLLHHIGHRSCTCDPSREPASRLVIGVPPWEDLSCGNIRVCWPWSRRRSRAVRGHKWQGLGRVKCTYCN